MLSDHSKRLPGPHLPTLAYAEWSAGGRPVRMRSAAGRYSGASRLACAGAWAAMLPELMLPLPPVRRGARGFTAAADCCTGEAAVVLCCWLAQACCSCHTKVAPSASGLSRGRHIRLTSALPLLTESSVKEAILAPAGSGDCRQTPSPPAHVSCRCAAGCVAPCTGRGRRL